ncbi:class I SAM-dependent methyltransferase [Glycomyces xiaoerkulensis]|uniref:class I SAM-dependent methyltransferase n=1 Tax=Glycomyces xiaoerkulensis TaxID=2038139 RepID=UPI000C25DB25|nr:class I SAM-dependent methyltransferase [Glycomyces xiaoerkulensis]
MSEWELERAIRAYYERGGEAVRLTADGQGRLEFARMRDLIRRLLPGDRLDVLDVGGATGVHAEWLAADGHRVTLVDPVESQVAAAAELPGVEALVGDARELPCGDDAFDAVLLMGPIYHLTDRSERVRALREASRAARPGAVVAAVTINRAAGWLDFLCRRVGGGAATISYEESLRALREGDIGYFDLGLFTTAYLHHPGEIADEFTEAGLGGPDQFAVQGPAGVIPDLHDVLDHEEAAVHYMEAMRGLEAEPSLLGASAHLLTVARAG